MESKYKSLADENATIVIKWKDGGSWEPFQGFEQLSENDFRMLNELLYGSPDLVEEIKDWLNKTRFIGGLKYGTGTRRSKDEE